MLKRQRFFEPPLRCLLALGLWLASNPLQGQSLLGTNPTLPQIHASTLAWADYDGDGDADLFAAGTEGNGLRRSYLLRNDNATTFVIVPIPVPGLANAAAAWADLDGDGDQDLAVSGDSARLTPVTRWYRNNGGASFSPMPLPAAAMMLGAVNAADFDGDGAVDLFLSGWNPRMMGTSALLRNNGSGTFEAMALPALFGLIDTKASVGDFDGDGDKDVLLSGVSQDELAQAVVLRNQGGMSFQAFNPGLSAVFTGNLCWADWDNDGDLDALGLGYAPGKNATLYRNQGGLQVPTASPIPRLGDCYAAWHNYDPSSGPLPDVAVAGNTDNGAVLRIYHNTGTGLADVQPGYPLPPLSDPMLAWADWDLDGYADLAVSGIRPNGAIALFLLRYNPSLQRFEP